MKDAKVEMRSIYRDYLFNKNILVANGTDENKFEILFSIANIFNIRIKKGAELVDMRALKFLQEKIPGKVTSAFYRGFPESVRSLTREQLIFDQLYHYFETYGLNNFEEDAAHSLFEEQFERTAFKESTSIVDFEVVNDEQGLALIWQYVADLLCSTRPLSEGMYDLVKTAIDDGFKVGEIASRDTAIKLLLDTKDSKYAKFINLSDTIKIVEEILHRDYPGMKINKLSLKNKDRKFIVGILDNMSRNPYQEKLCFEKRAAWKGLLHHIHYMPKNRDMKCFVSDIRNIPNISFAADFEKLMNLGDVIEAAKYLVKSKGNNALIRNINYIASRCEDSEKIKAVIDSLNNPDPVLLLQLIMNYDCYREKFGPRTFVFTKNYKLKNHRETMDEVNARRSRISEDQANVISSALWGKLKDVYKNKLGKVYIADKMRNIAVPLQETTSETGYGILPKGTRIHIPEGKIIRAFTYWEKVNDIDLSCIGVSADGKQTEFSWRTMNSYGYNGRGNAVTFSGDQTRGYNGGSEYFDIDFNAVRKTYPDLRYIVFCNNVFSGSPFDKCLCNAGYMVRDTETSGEIWEPKTVKSSYRITGNSTQSYLFALDLEKRDFVWLNMCKNTNNIISGEDDVSFLSRYIYMTEVMSVARLFGMLATEVVDDVEGADVVVCDESYDLDISQIQIKSTDTEAILKYLNNRA